MKRLAFSIIGILAALFLFSQTDEQAPLDLTSVAIKSPVAREVLGTDRIRVRNTKTTYVPRGVLPVLKVESPTRAECQDILKRILTMNDQQPSRVKMIGQAMTYQLDEASAWIHPASGSFKYTRTQGAKVAPARFEGFQEAVQAGLEYIAVNNLVDLVEGEELDISSVSAIHNALTEVRTPEKPKEEFISGYYVVFGRRYQGVPIIGSHLMLRFDGVGEVVMINKNWRRIVGVEKEAALRPEPLPALIYRSPRFQETYDGQDLSLEDIHVVHVRAGYLEAPFNYTQDLVRPGVVVTFWVGDVRDEMDQEIILPLEREGDSERLLGQPAQ